MKKEAVINGTLCVVECTIFGLSAVSLVVGALFGVSGDLLASGAEYIRTGRQGKGEEIFLNQLKQFKDKFIPAVNSFKAAIDFSNRFNERSHAPTANDVDGLVSDTGSGGLIPPEDESDKLVAEKDKAGPFAYHNPDNCC